jgi:hypothetical protein
MPRRREAQWVAALLIGDLATFLIATALGFVRHDEMLVEELPRMAATFLSFAVAWLVTSPWLGAFDLRRVSRPRSLWRPALAALLAAPTGAVLRGAWLASSVLPLFVLVMGAVTGALIVIWRALFWLTVSRRWSLQISQPPAAGPDSGFKQGV